MASLDIESLFTRCYSTKLSICVKKLFKTSQWISGLNKQEMHFSDAFINCEEKHLYEEFYYNQIDGVAMGSPFGPILANLFLCHHATKWLKNFPEGFKPIFYKRYVYDIFVLFEKPEQVLPFNHLIKKHKNINFPFLFSKLSVYRKDTFSLSYDI